MEKLLAREVTIFKKKWKDLMFYWNEHYIVRKAYQGSKHLNKEQIKKKLPETKVKDFWIISLAYAKSYSKTLMDVKFSFFKQLLSKCSQHTLGKKENT